MPRRSLVGAVATHEGAFASFSRDLLADVLTVNAAARVAPTGDAGLDSLASMSARA